MIKFGKLFIVLIFFANARQVSAQPNELKVIAYYSGGPEKIDHYPVEKLTHIIFCFSHLQGNRLHIDTARGEKTLNKLVSLKERNPSLKVLLSLGGWGGCKTCSDVFSSKKDRKEFVISVKEHLKKYKADGIDLDWEYPAIEGFPGHTFKPSDKKNFTKLVKELRKELGKKYEISFAAGGFESYLDNSVNWKKVMPLVNNVNLMSYDLVSGFSGETGHHTPLYSNTHQEKLSVDWGVNQLIKHGVPKEKIVIGAAFYGRMWENVSKVNQGIYQTGKFKKSESIRNIDSLLATDNNFQYFWDDIAKAPYIYNAAEKLFITYDDKRSIELKTKYVVEMKLGGIMFWELGLDYFSNGLLDKIDEVKNN